jgi:hypothetical protein
MYVAGTVVLIREYNPLAFLETVQRERITFYFGAPVSKADTVTIAAIEAGVPTLVAARTLTDRFAEWPKLPRPSSTLPFETYRLMLPMSVVRLRPEVVGASAN